MPMIEVKLDLVSVRIADDKRRDEVRFIPDLEESSGKGVRDLINSWVGSFFNVATLFKRLDNEGTYLREIHGDWDVMNLMAVINETLEANESLCLALKSQYEKHEYLWLTDLTEFFNNFKEEAMITTVNGQRLLDLQLYEEAITKYEGESKSPALSLNSLSISALSHSVLLFYINRHLLTTIHTLTTPSSITQ